MPAYQPPLRDYRFVLHETLKIQDETAIRGYDEMTEDFTSAVLAEAGKIAAEVLAPLNRVGDSARLPARERRRLHARRLQRGLGAAGRGRLAVAGVRPGLWRAGHAGRAEHLGRHHAVGRQHGVHDVPGPDAWRLFGDPCARHRGAEARLSAQARFGRVDGHDEPDRAAMRHGSGHAAHPRGAGRGRQLSDHRAENLHLVGRARPGREHRPPGAGPAAGRAGGHARHLAVRRSQVPRERGRQSWPEERVVLRQARGKDGHPRQRHLRDEL